MNSIFDVIHDIIGDFKDRQNEYSRDTFFTYKATKRAYFMMCLPYFIGFILGIIFAMVCEFGGAGQLITGEFAALLAGFVHSYFIQKTSFKYAVVRSAVMLVILTVFYLIIIGLTREEPTNRYYNY